MRQNLNANIGGTRVEMDDSGRIATIGRRGFIQGSLAIGAALAVPRWMPAAEAQIPVGKKLKIGYIGRGSVSHAYLPTLANAGFIELVSICDLIEDRAKDGAKQHKIPNVFPNIDAMLAGPKFDLLVNTTSMPSHYPVNRKALAAGCHVWSEKPMALEVKDAHELLSLAKKNGVYFWVAPTCVTSPQFRFMSDMIQSGKIGRVTAGHGTYGHGGPTWSAWFYEKGGGSLYDLGVYNVTTLTGLLGPVKSVVGMTAILNKTRKVNDKGEVQVAADENTMLIMDHGSGILSHVQTGFVYYDDEIAPSRERKLYTVEHHGHRRRIAPPGMGLGARRRRCRYPRARRPPAAMPRQVALCLGRRGAICCSVPPHRPEEPDNCRAWSARPGGHERLSRVATNWAAHFSRIHVPMANRVG